MSTMELKPAPKLIRHPDWPERLAEVIESARHQPYVLGQHDCVRLACRCIEVMTGVNFWPVFAGYKTKVQALRVIARIAPSLEGAVTCVLGIQPQPVALSRRGDVLLYQDEEGHHLGVCAGANMVLLAEQGLIFLPLSKALASWRIG